MSFFELLENSGYCEKKVGKGSEMGQKSDSEQGGLGGKQGKVDNSSGI